MNPVDKVLGADVELGNAIVSGAAAVSSNHRAAQLLLAEIDGVPASGSGEARCRVVDSRGTRSGHGADPGGVTERVSERNPQDWGRKFLPTNGGCAYVDLGHLELCTPEVRSARDFVRYHHANLALARAACAAANARLPEGERLVVMANNSDRLGNSWGGHLNVLIRRELWQRMFDRLHPDLFVLAAFQVSSILYTGQGKCGSENGKPSVPFQLTQRGDFFECMVGEQTTHRRPIANSRWEPHCGAPTRANALARLHVIFHDTTQTHTSNYLKAGVTQLVLALLETGWCDRRVLLADPLEALTAWGHDPELRARARLDDGRRITAIEHQRLFLDAVKAGVAAGDAGCVPEADDIVATWEDTLDRLERRDFATLARRLDWVMKRELLARAIERNAGLDWNSPAIRAADLLFASLDPVDGLYAAIAESGGADTLVAQADIERAMTMPPDDTRAWARAMILRHVRARGTDYVDWDEIRLRPARPGDEPVVLRLGDPRRFTRDELRHRRAAAGAHAGRQRP
jgi:proteasome accessory factor A